MSSNWRRFELLLPLQFNDGRDVPSDETQKLEGHWRHEGVMYRDTLVRLTVDVPDTSESRQWMKEFKGRWRTRLEQLELWMISHEIDVE